MAARQRPGLPLFLSEPGRALGEYGAMLAGSPVLLAAPRGDGHAVLVLPGLLAEDGSTLTLRTYLRTRGYAVHGWNLGRNLGPTAKVREGMTRLLRELAERGGERVSIVGWSLGGIFARELARAEPRLVRQVITLGSPFRLADPRDSRAHSAFQRYSRLHADPRTLPTRAARHAHPGSFDGDLLTLRRHRALAGLRRGAWAEPRERGRVQQPPWARPQPGGALGGCRSARSARR